MEIKQLIEDQDFESALNNLVAVVGTQTDPDDLLYYSTLAEKIPLTAYRARGVLHKKIAILGGYSTQMISQLLRVELLKVGIIPTLFEAGYGTLESTVYSKDPELKAFAPDLCFFCVGVEHLGSGSVEEEANRWAALWKETREFLGCEIIQNTFEEPRHLPYGNFELKAQASRLRFVRELNLKLGVLAPSYVHFNDIDRLASFVGRKAWRDDRLYDMAKFPVSHSHLVTYVKNAAAVISSVYGGGKKCLVLDLDNTLWGGVIGDDGLDGIEIGDGSPAGEAFKRFQVYIRGLKDRGVLLAVCSKNEASIAKEAFRKRAEMVLKLEDFSCFMANWEPKPDNLVRIANELNIGMDSLVFVDDNPVERDAIRQLAHGVTVVDLPSDPAEYATALAEAHLFEPVLFTQEDSQRSAQYQANAQRSQLESAVQDYDQFLASLEMKATIAPFDALHLPRIAQLVNKTNQFNLTTKRYTESNVDDMMKDGRYFTRYVKLADKFGDNGLISVFIARQTSEAEFEIDTWLMSCRVLKRGVEQLLFHEVAKGLFARGARRLVGDYLPTPKNALVKDLLASLGFQRAGSGWVFELRPAGPYFGPIELASEA